jgi:S-DNA-T family DNA segregation ATPase FtsK/SpoIIIE
MTLTLHLPRPAGNRPAGTRAFRPGPLSLWDPAHLGVDPYGDPVTVTLAYRNLVIGGLPDAGKSNGLALILGHAALSLDVRRVWLFDGKETELVFWEPLAARSVGRDPDDALNALAELQALLDSRLTELKAAGLRKITRESGHGFDLVVIDELALYTATYGEPAQQKRFAAGVRDLIARGRAAGMVLVIATQRPSSDIVPTSLRDLIAYRWALACANDASSDVVLGDGQANDGYSAASIDTDTPGVGWLRAENGRVPRLFKANYLSDEDIRYLVSVGLSLRGRPGLLALHGPAGDGGEPG